MSNVAVKTPVKHVFGKEMQDRISRLDVAELNNLNNFVTAKLDEAKASAKIKLQTEIENLQKANQAEIAKLIEQAGFAPDVFTRKTTAKVAAKFANPANPSETWTGRGRQPNWLTAKLKNGAKLEDFALK